MTPTTLNIITVIAQFGLFLATVGLVVVGYFEVNKVRRQNNADFIARLNREFFYESTVNREIIRAIEEHRPILHGNNGDFSEYDLRSYLRYFEMIERFISEGVISFGLVDEMFGSYISRAWENDEVREFIARVRQEKKDRRYFEHFEQLAKKTLETEKQSRG
jgi:hypothetical protein